jgi:hypothetical protein
MVLVFIQITGTEAGRSGICSKDVVSLIRNFRSPNIYNDVADQILGRQAETTGLTLHTRIDPESL